MKQLNQNGFTLVELMLATSIFTLVMIIATTGFIAINRTFTRGLIRKQLAENIQQVTADVTSIIRTHNQSGGVVTCSATSGGSCPSGWNALCFSGARYIWKDSGGMYKDYKKCNDPDFSTKTELVDARFKVQNLSVSSSSDNLFNIHGVISTSDPEALSQNPVTDPDTLSCKGSAESAAVRTCALQKFDFLVNSRGV